MFKQQILLQNRTFLTFIILNVNMQNGKYIQKSRNESLFSEQICSYIISKYDSFTEFCGK